MKKLDKDSAIPSTNPIDAAPVFKTVVKKAGKIEKTISEEKSLKKLVIPKIKMFLDNPKILFCGFLSVTCSIIF